MCEENTLTCYETDPRANLFRKHQGSVSTIIDMQRIMGLNEYATDILALNDSCNVSTIISVRTLHVDANLMVDLDNLMYRRFLSLMSDPQPYQHMHINAVAVLC